MGIEVSEKAKKIINSKHIGNARGYAAEITNLLHNAYVDNNAGLNSKELSLDKTQSKLSKKNIEQLEVDKAALEEFQIQTFNRIPKEPIDFDPKKYL